MGRNHVWILFGYKKCFETGILSQKLDECHPSKAEVNFQESMGSQNVCTLAHCP